MAIANAFSRGFAAVTVVSVADVNQILSAIRTLLTSTLPVADRWVETATDKYAAPADPVSGARMKLEFTRFDATRIDVTPRDKNDVAAASLPYTIPGFSGSANCRIFAGPTHFMMYRTDGATTDNDFMAWVADPSPEAANSQSPVNFVRSQRSAGGINNIGTENHRPIPADGQAGYQPRMSIPAFSSNPGIPNGTLLTAGGSELILPIFFVTYGATNANPRGCGQAPQAVWVDQSHSTGQLITVAIDTGVMAIFEVTNMITEGFGANGCARLAIRVG